MSQSFKPQDYIYPTPLDWPTICRDITNTGLLKADMAELLGIHWSTVDNYFAGSEPKESRGRALLMLHWSRCGPDLTIQRIAEGGGVKQIQYLISLWNNQSL